MKVLEMVSLQLGYQEIVPPYIYLPLALTLCRLLPSANLSMQLCISMRPTLYSCPAAETS